MDEQKLKELLLEKNEEFRRAYEEHQRLEQEIAGLRGKPRLSETEALDERDMKKRKLVLKDKMYRMMAEAGEAI